MMRTRWAAVVLCMFVGATAGPSFAGPEAPSVEVGDANGLVASEGDKLHVALTRRGHPGPAIEVHYRTEERPPGEGSAVSGTDFMPTSGTVVFPAGAKDGAVLAFNVELIEDSDSEQDERFNVIVESDDAMVSEPVTEALIDDDDVAPEPCHCYISGVKVFGCVPQTACQVCCTEPTGVRLTCKDKARMAALFRQNQLV